jgi:hypothetical protein
MIETAEWRKEHAIETALLPECVPANRAQYESMWRSSIIGADKDGHPIVYEAIGKIPTKEFANAFVGTPEKEANFLAHCAYNKEVRARARAPALLLWYSASQSVGVHHQPVLMGRTCSTLLPSHRCAPSLPFRIPPRQILRKRNIATSAVQKKRIYKMIVVLDLAGLGMSHISSTFTGLLKTYIGKRAGRRGTGSADGRPALAAVARAVEGRRASRTQRMPPWRRENSRELSSCCARPPRAERARSLSGGVASVRSGLESGCAPRCGGSIRCRSLCSCSLC